jgi:hypothetical protein
MQDIVPMTWVNSTPGGAVDLTDSNFNTEVRNSYLLLLNPPTCQITRATNQVIAVGTYFTAWVAVSFSTLIFDTEAPADPMFAIGSPTRITCKTAGWYECIAVAEETSLPATNVLTGALRVNGTTFYLGDTIGLVGDTMHTHVKHLLPLAVNDYVEFMVTHDSATTVNIIGGAPNPATMTLSRRRGI